MVLEDLWQISTREIDGRNFIEPGGGRGGCRLGGQTIHPCRLGCSGARLPGFLSAKMLNVEGPEALFDKITALSTGDNLRSILPDQTAIPTQEVLPTEQVKVVGIGDAELVGMGEDARLINLPESAFTERAEEKIVAGKDLIDDPLATLDPVFARKVHASHPQEKDLVHHRYLLFLLIAQENQTNTSSRTLGGKEGYRLLIDFKKFRAAGGPIFKNNL